MNFEKSLSKDLKNYKYKTMKSIAAIAIASALAPGYAQVPGKQKILKAHPQLSTSECTIAGG